VNRRHLRRCPRPVDPEPSRYDAEWPDVLAAEADPSRMAAEDAALADLAAMQEKVNETWAHLAASTGGDLAAMAAPWPGMARDDLGTYAEPVSRWHGDGLGVGEWHEPVPYVPADPPRGRHRQTDPLDLILADLRDLDGQP